MGETFAEFGDIVFSLVIGYLSAIEFLYVVRHLYHYSFNHDANNGIDDGENLSQLQDSMRQQLANAKYKEAAAGTQVMKDGVPYKDGFRLEAQQALIDQLKEQLKDKELSDLRRKELEKELAAQIKIAEKLRKELDEAEGKYQRQLKQEDEARGKKLLEEQKQHEIEERVKKEAEEQARRIAEAERQREAEERKREEEEHRRKEAEQKEREPKQREEQERKEAEEQVRRIAEAEKQREAEQRKWEEEERKRKEAEQKENERKQRDEQERKEAEEQARGIVEAEKQREAEQRKWEEEEHKRKEAEQKENERNHREKQERKEAEEEERRLAEAEKQREVEQRQREEAEENACNLQEAEKQRENEQRRLEEEDQEMTEAEENELHLLAIEKANEEKQVAAEEAEAELAARNLLAIEHRLEEQLRAAEREAELTENERQLIDSIKQRDLNEEAGNEDKEAELLRKILQAREQLGDESEEEQTLRLIQRERDQEAKQKRIEENAVLFMEAEKELAEIQSKMLDAVEKREFSGYLDSAPQTPVVEEPCIKRNVYPLSGGESSYSTVKTQLAQDLNEPYSVRTKPLLFPGVSDDASSIDPASSQQSSFSTQPSEEITTGTESQYPPQERQEPDGEDTALTNIQYSDDYLRSLDGIKQRPLQREDGSGRRRAFKKRRSSNSSNSSRESRQSRDEELKMFTSLEEEEMKDGGVSEFTPIRYTTEPTLKVKGHHRRHKRSPAKDMRRGDDSLRSSLERLGEETSDPWGEVKPEHYKHTEFWKREKTLSIDEEIEFEKPVSSEEVPYDPVTNMPSASSFEEATQKQNQEALTTLQKHSAQKDAQEGHFDIQTAPKEEAARSDNTNLQPSQIAEKEASPARASATPHLRRSPRIEEVDQHEERGTETNYVTDNSTAQNTPTINVEAPLDYEPWRDQYGLMMEGLSDFYDFTASINPSRSRPASRNVSPANTAPNTPLPKDVSFQLNTSNNEINGKTAVEIYDDTGNVTDNEFKMENVIKFIDTLNVNEGNVEEQNKHNTAMETEVGIKQHLKYVADDPSKALSNQTSLLPLVNIIDDVASNVGPNFEDSGASGDAARNVLVSSLRSQEGNRSRSRSRSKSPLPTPDNLKRSVENRRYKMIKHNEDILEKLIESKLLPELTPPEEIEEKSHVTSDNENSCQEQMSSLHVERNRARSKSPMRLPTVENLSKGLEKRRTKLIERNDELIKQLEERSQTPESPTIVVKHVYEIESSEQTQCTTAISSPTEEEEDDCSREKMDLLVQSLRVARSKTKSKSPLPVKESETLETKIFYGFQHTEHVETMQQLRVESRNVPSISIGFSESETESTISAKVDDEDECSREKMDSLIQSLRAARSRSTSKSPMRLPADKLMQHIEERAKTPEPYVYELEMAEETDVEGQRSRHSRSKSPSRSHSISYEAAAAYRSSTSSRSLSPQRNEYDEFHVMLNLEGSTNRTLSVTTEEQESLLLANRQRHLDEEALEKLRNASEEIELRTLSPLVLGKDELTEETSQDYLAELPLTERNKFLKKSPTTPDYDRTISEEMRDVERIKQEMLEKGFKRSTYVGESMDLGSEFEPLRREAAKFQRSRTPSPSVSTIESATAQRRTEERRKIQDLILKELTTSSSTDGKECRNTGAIPKVERFSSGEIELSPNNDVEDAKCINEDILRDSFQRSTYSVEKTEHFEELRRRNAEFRRSASASRSPLRESQLEELANIEAEAAKRVLKDKFVNEVSCNSPNFQDVCRHLNADFFDNDSRASDSALIRVPQGLEDMELEPEEYHHYRRFSLAQEEPIEQYPGDDYIFIQQVEVRTRSGSRTWLREDFYSENVDEYLARAEQSQKNFGESENTESAGSEEQSDRDQEERRNIPAADDDENYSNASEDDRQTVVEVDDEIDEDISDFNERGPAEESHHETSECEEAEREMDRYAGREASDWNRAVDVDDIRITGNRATEMVTAEEHEGAVGGLSNSPYDSDSFAIDQIYDEAIKNRKQSGILREYDSILVQMSMNSDIEEQQLMWARTSGKKNPKNVEFNTQYLDNEYKVSEMRYLGDANVTARQSARLRSRYGYNPVLQSQCMDDDLQVDLNYKPKREYNWRKNFKLDEDIVKEDKEITLSEICSREEEEDNIAGERSEEINDSEAKEHIMDARGGESVTLFSCSPEKNISLVEDRSGPKEELINGEEFKEEKVEKTEKSKKKKTKKKSHKESKAILEETMNREDEDAYDNQVYCRRSSSLQMDTDSPKRKSHSRRSSKNSLTNEDSLGVFSPRSNVIYNEIMEVAKDTARPKKMKKRKKVKEPMANVAESPIENIEKFQYIMEPFTDIPAVSTAITPESSSANILSTLSPQNSVCVTPASTDTDVNLSVEELRESCKETTTTSSSTTASSPSGNVSRSSSLTTTPVDTFDILKDANFYPLF